MSSPARTFRKLYGSHPLHLLTLIGGFALFGYVVATLGPAQLWNPQTWWQSIAVWFAASIIAHDLVLFPVYALVDRILVVATPRRRTDAERPRVPALNYIRIPLIGAALTLVIFLPGIIEQGAPTFHAATGLTQEPYLGRWLLLTAILFGVSALAYALALIRSSIRSAQTG
ncbi:hypothetical protein H7J51_19750 [Mycobacterium crocinum]|uniref:Lipoprotein n=1 Tax=Mycolicibacterium crocinum TaxID=388459 RepID=A0ABY3TRS7_9MYCO|nr:hypothetical protein [Mycolicibacterium crocinum]MCV7217514.1 hypothetical protein [Mycolicibacterium crocinum]ULN42394.1 hypothetical protein MI149_04535 [Mycolicibacterium crocinum]